MSSLPQDHLKTLEQSRQRLIQLTHSLHNLIESLNKSDPLPSWPSLQSQANIISNNLLSISEHLSENHSLLTSLIAYPSPEFPTKTHANTLEQLLRTKLDPRVEEWVARGRKCASTSASASSAAAAVSSSSLLLSAPGLGSGGAGLSEAQLEELWAWAPVEANQEARRRNWGGNFTLEERERGIAEVLPELGLRRVLEDEEEEEERDEEEEGEGEDEMEVVGVRKSLTGTGLEYDIAVGSGAAQATVAPVVPLDELLRYMTTGVLPGQR